LSPIGDHDILEKERHSCRIDRRCQHLPSRNDVCVYEMKEEERRNVGGTYEEKRDA